MSKNIQFILENFVKLGDRFEKANNKYDELKESYQISEYFSSDEHAIYKFCSKKLEGSKNYEEKLKNIIEIRRKKFIDIIFIGQCSVGKSKIINAILMENILPCAPSATTHCFVDISKSNDAKNYLSCNNVEKKYFEFDNLISEIKNNVSSISDSFCEFNESVQIFLSKWQTKLPNVKQTKMIRLIDTPGYDNYKLSSNSIVNSSIEKLIIDRCKISNIIVLVVTHELADKENKFLEKLCEISSELSILVLVNKWDLSDNDSDEITNASKSNIRDSFNNVNQTYLKDRIYFVSALEEMKQISSQNSNERQEEFLVFLKCLNKEINDQNFLKFNKDISIIETFYDETNNKYKKSVQNLSNNIEYFINRLDEIKKELEYFQIKNRKMISKIKQTEKKNFDSSKKFDLVDQLDKKFDSLEIDLQNKLQILYHDFINENYHNYNKYLQQSKQLFAKSWDKSRKTIIRKLKKHSIRDKLSEEVATEATKGSTQNEYFCEKLLQCIDSKLSIITDQINNMSTFFQEYCGYLKYN